VLWQFGSQITWGNKNLDMNAYRGDPTVLDRWFTDWTEEVNVATFPYGYSGAMLTMAQMELKQTVYKLNSEFWRRYRALCEYAATQGVGLGVGTGWRKQPNPPPPGFAKPGNSNHEGFPADGTSGGAVAIDTVPKTSWEWMQRNLKAYGLRSFKYVNNEPWHIQPAEIPASRRWRREPWKLAAFPLPTTPSQPISEEDDDIMYLANLADGNVVVVGSSVRPVSGEEISGPFSDLQRVTPLPSSYWHQWLQAAADEYTQRVGMG
jgi:hypothetical protein